MRPLPFAAALLALTACTVETPAEPPEEPAPETACGANELQYLVGQPQTALAGLRLPASTRFIGPNTAVTMDYNPERLNIRYNERGIIVEVYCG